MTDSSEPTTKKPLGRNQKIAAIGYLVPWVSVVLPAVGTLAMSWWRNDFGTALAVLDRLITFAEVYGLIAVGCLLGISGAVKGVSAMADAAIAKVGAKP